MLFQGWIDNYNGPSGLAIAVSAEMFAFFLFFYSSAYLFKMFIAQQKIKQENYKHVVNK